MVKRPCEYCGSVADIPKDGEFCRLCGLYNHELPNDERAVKAADDLIEVVFREQGITEHEFEFYVVRLDGRGNETPIDFLLTPLIKRDSQYRAYNAMLKALQVKEFPIQTVRGDKIREYLRYWWSHQFWAGIDMNKAYEDWKAAKARLAHPELLRP